MDFDKFKRIVTTFADEDEGIVVEGSRLLLQIRGSEVEVELLSGKDGGVSKVVMHGEKDREEWSAVQWIRSYLAKLDHLADQIIEHIDPPENYVSPKVDLLDWRDEPMDDSSHDSATMLREYLTTRVPAGETSIYFLTSDAGEGKTSLIKKIAVDQALEFKAKKEDIPLVIPVPLGGTSFLRFDDVVIASLMNKLRFPYLYYDSFLELIRINAIVPAFDGYEEVLVDIKSGEALSAIGSLVNQLSSTGTLLFAARKAYFESSLNSRKLVDSIRSDGQEARIQRFSLERWNREVFLEYATKRDVPKPRELYERVKKRLRGEDHPLLTRAVLVKRLIDVAIEEDHLGNFLQRLGRSQEEGYFFDFIESIVEREVKEKWIDRSGDQSPLLTLEEHHELLSHLSFEMWVDGVDALRPDMTELVVEFFAEEKDLNPDVQRQILRRIPDHSLLRKDSSQGTRRSNTRIRFDHEEFQEFYLGQSLGRALGVNDVSHARLILSARGLTLPVILEAARYLRDKDIVSIDDLLDSLQRLSRGERLASYIRENCGALMLELIRNGSKPRTISDINFPVDALQDRDLRNLTISNSFFSSTRLGRSKIIDCKFDECRFGQLIVNREHKLELDGTVFDNCKFYSVVIYGDSEEEDQQAFFNPDRVNAVLSDHGIRLTSDGEVVVRKTVPEIIDRQMKMALQFMKIFNRATTIKKDIIHKRFGKNASYFFKAILPELQRVQIVESPKSSRNKFRLMVSLSTIDDLIEKSGSRFDKFIQEASRELTEPATW